MEFHKSLAYEETKEREERNTERLPSNHGRVFDPPPFDLTVSRARFSIRCTDCNCRKPRIVYSMKAPSQKKIDDLKETLKDSTYKCGDRIDVLKVFAVNERMHCTSDVEKPFYSGLVDSTASKTPVCYSCGDEINLYISSW